MAISIGQRHVYLAVFIVNIVGFIEGCILTWSSPIFPKLLRDDDQNPLGRIITTDETSWLASLYSIGAAVGAFIFAFVFEKYGRRIGLIANLVPHIVAFSLFMFGRNIWLFFVGRFLGGIALGAGVNSVAIYIGEVSPKHHRGFLATSTTVFIMGGCLFSYCVGPYTSIMVFNIILAVFPIVCLIGVILFVPETPYFLIQKNKEDEGLKSLRILRGTSDVDTDKEFEYMKDDVFKVKEGGVLDIFKSRAATKAFFIVTMIVNFHNFSGIYIVLAYTELIFQDTGGQFTSDISSIIVGVTQFITVFSAPALVERLGRKPLFYISLSGVIVNLAIIGGYLFAQDEGVDVDNITWIPLVAFVLYFAFYNLGLGSLPFTLLSELYPLHVKSAGSSITMIIYYVVGFLLSYNFNNLVEAIGMGEAFWMFSGICCGTVLFVYFFVIETKGKSLQEIQDILAK